MERNKLVTHFVNSECYSDDPSNANHTAQAKLDGQPGHETIGARRDLVGLLKLIQSICCKFKANTQAAYALLQAMKEVFLFLTIKFPAMTNTMKILMPI